LVIIITVATCACLQLFAHMSVLVTLTSKPSVYSQTSAELWVSKLCGECSVVTGLRTLSSQMGFISAL